MANDPSDNAERGTGWIDQPDDANVIAVLVEKIKAQQATIAASNKTHLDGRVDRGQHQKQTLVAFGTLRIFDAIPPALQQLVWLVRGLPSKAIASKMGLEDITVPNTSVTCLLTSTRGGAQNSS